MVFRLDKFAKYEGLGNDFIVVDAANAPVGLETSVKALCDRHFGIGADGVLLLLPASSAGARARMLVINADGSQPEMCGNGLRCVALHLALRDAAFDISYVIDTDAGPRLCEVERHGRRATVRLAMGQAVVQGRHAASHDGVEHAFVRVSTGNPHLVLFDAGYGTEQIDVLAPKVSAGVDGGANVGFATLRDARLIDLVVWERGVGRTLACGTGAVACVAAACELGRVAFGETIEVRLPGGPLEVRVARDGEAMLRGPARLVFTGELCGE